MGFATPWACGHSDSRTLCCRGPAVNCLNPVPCGPAFVKMKTSRFKGFRSGSLGIAALLCQAGKIAKLLSVSRHNLTDLDNHIPRAQCVGLRKRRAPCSGQFLEIQKDLPLGTRLASTAFNTSTQAIGGEKHTANDGSRQISNWTNEERRQENVRDAGGESLGVGSKANDHWAEEHSCNDGCSPWCPSPK